MQRKLTTLAVALAIAVAGLGGVACGTEENPVAPSGGAPAAPTPAPTGTVTPTPIPTIIAN